MIQWKDETSYRQHERSKGPYVHPRTWKADVNGIDLTVTRHIHAPGVWLMNSRHFGIDLRALKSDGIEAAKLEAIEILGEEITAQMKVLQGALKLLCAEGGEEEEIV